MSSRQFGRCDDGYGMCKIHDDESHGDDPSVRWNAWNTTRYRRSCTHQQGDTRHEVHGMAAVHTPAGSVHGGAGSSASGRRPRWRAPTRNSYAAVGRQRARMRTGYTATNLRDIVSELRKRLEPDRPRGVPSRLLETVPGIGYRLVLVPSSGSAYSTRCAGLGAGLTGSATFTSPMPSPRSRLGLPMGPGPGPSAGQSRRGSGPRGSRHSRSP